jgi:hypothetical protein
MELLVADLDRQCKSDRDANQLARFQGVPLQSVTGWIESAQHDSTRSEMRMKCECDELACL